MGLGIPPLDFKIMLESNPLTSIILLGRLGVLILSLLLSLSLLLVLVLLISLLLLLLLLLVLVLVVVVVVVVHMSSLLHSLTQRLAAPGMSCCRRIWRLRDPGRLYYTILYCSILYCTIIYYTILYYTILYYTIIYYSRLPLF